MSAAGKLRVLAGDHLGFYCPGCERAHVIRIGANGWGYNGNPDAPTFTPSVFSNQPGPYYTESAPSCHSFITDGHIQFLGDSTHSLAGQTVPLPHWPEGYGP